MILVCRVILQDYVIKGSCDVFLQVDGKKLFLKLLWACDCVYGQESINVTIMPSMVAIGTVVMEI